MLSSSENFLCVRATEATVVVRMDRPLVQKLLNLPAGRPALDVLLRARGVAVALMPLVWPLSTCVVTQMVLRTLSPLVRQVDFALDWLHLDAGQRLFSQGDPTTNLYIVLSGRVRSVQRVSLECLTSPSQPSIPSLCHPPPLGPVHIPELWVDSHRGQGAASRIRSP